MAATFLTSRLGNLFTTNKYTVSVAVYVALIWCLMWQSVKPGRELSPNQLADIDVLSSPYIFFTRVKLTDNPITDNHIVVVTWQFTWYLSMYDMYDYISSTIRNPIF